MAVEGSDDRPYADTLTVPSVLVMPDEAWPAAFYSRYSQAFRVPVRVVQREEAQSQDGTLPLRPPASSPQASSPPDEANAVAPEASPEQDGTRDTGAVREARASFGRRDPVGIFLRINDALSRRQGHDGETLPESVG